MRSFIAGDDRQQTWLLPQSLEDYVSADNPMRFIEAFVDQLDFARADLPNSPQAPGGPGMPAQTCSSPTSMDTSTGCAPAGNGNALPIATWRSFG